LIVFLGLLVVVAWYVSSARWVRFEITPVPERMILHGALLPVPLKQGYLLRPGSSYRLEAFKPGYRRLVSAVVPEDVPRQQFRYQMEKLPGNLELISEPPALVSLDGEERGMTPLRVSDLAAGDYQVRFDAERYVPFQSSISIQGMGIEQRLDVELEPNWAQVSVAASPRGGFLWVDGERRASLPVTLDIEAGDRDLVIRLDGYKDWESRVRVVAGEPLSLEGIELQPADATLELSSRPTGANVSLDGRYMGKTPIQVPVAVGKDHRMSLSRAGYQTENRQLRLDNPGHERLRVDMTPIKGWVDIRAEPPEALLFVDGKARGEASQKLELTTLPHRIEIRHKGYETFTTEVTPQAGFAEEVRVSLKAKSGNGTPGMKNKEPPKEMPVGGKPVIAKEISAPDGQTLRLIEPGSLTMGASRREQGRRGNEVLKTINLTRPFYLGIREVTNAQFRRFLSSHHSGYFNGLNLDMDVQPVVNVDWNQAAEFCNWLSLEAGLPTAYEKRADGSMVLKRPVTRGYRLPTEAEWAWAARKAGRSKVQKFPWGDRMPPIREAGNYADQSDASYLANTIYDYNDGYAATAPPGSFRASPAGLFDMSGNVAEWVNDYYAIDTSSIGRTVQDPLGPESGVHHVVRGSSWMSASISELRWTYRDYSKKPRPDVGFRIARYAD
jgi:formylglycine-generating enzyme required for sulfatase activity